MDSKFLKLQQKMGKKEKPCVPGRGAKAHCSNSGPGVLYGNRVQEFGKSDLARQRTAVEG